MKSRWTWVLAAMCVLGMAGARADGPATAPSATQGADAAIGREGQQFQEFPQPPSATQRADASFERERTPAQIELDRINALEDACSTFEWSTFDNAKKTLDEHPDLIHYVTRRETMMGERGGETLLQSVAEQGDAAKIQLLLARGADINEQTKWYSWPLLLAVDAGKPDAVQLLIQKGADVNVGGTNGPTALQDAVLGDNAEIIAMLIHAGAKENIFTAAARGNLDFIKQILAQDPKAAGRDDGGKHAPLFYAGVTGQIEVAKLLVAAGAALDPQHGEDSALYEAVDHKHFKMAEFLLDAHADPDAGSIESPLCDAVYNNDVDAVQLLLAHKAKTGIVSGFYGQTALHMATSHGSLEMVRMLLDAGADINETTHGIIIMNSNDRPPPSDETPFAIAASGCRMELLQFLESRGANINARDSYGQNALHRAAGSGVQDRKQANMVVAWLLSLKFDVNGKDDYGDTPLHLAAQSGDPDRIKLLLNAKADINALNKNGELPIHCATSAEVVKALVDAGADINAKVHDDDGDTVFLCAAKHHLMDVMKYLATHGAKVDAVDATGRTALDLAEFYAEVYPDRQAAIEAYVKSLGIKSGQPQQ